MTEAATALAQALDDAGLPELAERARTCEFDDLYSPHPFPQVRLIEQLARAGRPDLIDQVTADRFEPTDADKAAYENTDAGRAARAEYEQVMADPQVAAAADRFVEALSRADPKHLNRIVKDTVAQIAEHAAPTDEVPDDDDCVPTVDLLPEPVRQMIGRTGPDGQRLDTPTILAAADLALRAGAVFDIGWARQDAPAEQRGWYAHAGLDGQRVAAVVEAPGPNAAAAAFAEQLLTGSQCAGCRRDVAVSQSGPGRADGRCVWHRHGARWVSGCTERLPSSGSWSTRPA